MPSVQPFVKKVRHRLGEYAVVHSLRDRLKKALFICTYSVRRAIGYATFPILGARAPLRGIYARTQDYFKHGDGLYMEFERELASSTQSSVQQSSSDIFVAVIPNGRTIYNSGAVITPDHKLLADVSWEDLALDEFRLMSHPLMNRRKFPRNQHISGSVAIITSYMPDNYYHWLFDILPRFDILSKSKLVPDRYLVNAGLPFQRESLSFLNIPARKILTPTMGTNFEFDELIIPSLPGPALDRSPRPQEFSCRFLRSAFLDGVATGPPCRALYITRADAGARRVINEPEVQEVLRQYGFEVVSLTGIPFLRQVALFSEARIIVGAHGAGFANAVFCQPGSRLVEFMPETRPVDCFERLARIIGMKYDSIIGRPDDAAGQSGDHMIDIPVLRDLLSQLLVMGEL